MKEKFIYECSDCGLQYDARHTMYLCPACSSGNQTGEPVRGVLKVLYDYLALKERLPSGLRGFARLKRRGFLDLLPIQRLESLPPLRIGQTPMYAFERFDGMKWPRPVYFKDDGVNPSFSLKDRASALVSAYAGEHGYETIVAASTGNAGSSIAGICASQGQRAVVMVPESAPPAKLIQIMMYGAQIVKVKGTYDEAFELSIQASREHGWYNRNTAYNPLTIEGKKTVAFEAFEQLGYRVPARIFVSAGDGVILSGIYKGFEELLKLGLSDTMPAVVAVQSENSDNLVRNLEADVFKVKKSHTIADSISVDIPRNFLMARQYLHTYGGEGLTVSDQAILKASILLAGNTGIFTEPASAAAFAGYLQYKETHGRVGGPADLVILTGSGLKDIGAFKDVHKKKMQ